MKDAKRLRRQFDALGRGIPVTQGMISWLLAPGMRLYRMPFGIVLVLGGIFSFLPVLGLWMLPLGLMLLAVDIPPLRPFVSTGMIRLRRRITIWRVRARRGRRSEPGRSGNPSL